MFNWCKWVARARKGFGLRLVSCWAAKFGADFVVTVRVGCWAEKLGALFPLARVPARFTGTHVYKHAWDVRVVTLRLSILVRRCEGHLCVQLVGQTTK